MSDRICQGYTSADAHLRILTSHLPVFVLLKTSLVLIHNKPSLYFLAYQSIIFIYFYFFQNKATIWNFHKLSYWTPKPISLLIRWQSGICNYIFGFSVSGEQLRGLAKKMWPPWSHDIIVAHVISSEHRDRVGHKSTYILQWSSRSILQVCLIWN